MIACVRHAQSLGNILGADGRAQHPLPNWQYDLTEEGRAQARIMGEYLKEQGHDTFPLCLHSTYRRTKETAEIIAGTPGLNIGTIRATSLLDEKWDGVLHDLSKEEIEKYYPEQARLRERTGYYHHRAPGGQNCPDVELYVREFLREWGDYEGPLLVVGHGRWFQIFQRFIHRIPIQDFNEQVKSVANCSLTIYPDFRQVTEETPLPECVVPWRGQLEERETTLA